jgi:hypothetical protein
MGSKNSEIPAKIKPVDKIRSNSFLKEVQEWEAPVYKAFYCPYP